jgi:hypothetical protein
MSKEEIPTFCCLFELRCSKFFATLKKETFVTRRPGLSECPVPDAVRRRQLEKQTTTKSMNPLSSNDDSPRSKKRAITVEDSNQEVLDARNNLKELESIRDRALSQPLKEKEKEKNLLILSGSTAQLPQLPQLPPISPSSPRGRRAKIFDNQNDSSGTLESNEYVDSSDTEVNHGSNGSGMRRRMREVSEMYSKALKNSAETQLLEKLSNVQITDPSIDEVGSEVMTSPRSILGANRNRESVTINSQSMRGVRNLRRY